MNRTAGSVSPTEADEPWGLAETALGWFAAQVVATGVLLTILSMGGWDPFQPARPGGFLGRTVGQSEAGVELVDDSLPLVAQMFSLFGLWIPLLAVPWVVAYFVGHSRPGWRVELERADIVRGVAGGVLLQIPLIPLVYVVVQWIFGEFESSNRAFVLADQADSWAKIVMLYAFVAVGAPVVEELFYRGLLQPAIIRKIGPLAGIAVSGFLFGAVHFALVELPALTLVGLVLGYLAWSTGRLGPAIIAHITFNAFTLTAILAQ